MKITPIRTATDVLELETSMVPSTLPPVSSALELYQCQIVRLRPLFENLLWDGLTMFVAKPKAGKSCLTLQMAICVAGGRTVEGLTPTETGFVLYVALEEPKARTISRLRT